MTKQELGEILIRIEDTYQLTEDERDAINQVLSDYILVDMQYRGITILK